MNKKVIISFITFITVLILIFIYYGINSTPAYRNDEASIFQRYLEPYSLPSDWKKLPATSDKYAAFLLYNQKDYSEALVNLKYAILNNPEDLQLKFYAGMCMILTGDVRDSIREFNIIIEERDEDSLRDAAKWYKSLALIKLNRVSQAKRLLSEINSLESKAVLEELAVDN